MSRRPARPDAGRPAPGVLTVLQAQRVAGDLLSRRPWTRAQLEARLQRRGAPPPVAAAVAADLVARGLLDDAAFARQWVQARAGRGYGPGRLRAELRARGVAEPLIAAALGLLPPGAALARALAGRRLPQLRRARPDRRAARLRDYLARRGFAPAVVARVVRETLGAEGLDAAPAPE